jgi:hypothetical protein
MRAQALFFSALAAARAADVTVHIKTAAAVNEVR